MNLLGKLRRRIPRRSIRNKIIGFFLMVIMMIVVFFETFSIASLYDYYYSNTAGILYNQARYNSELYLSYLSDDNLMNVVVNNRDQFYRNNVTQVQILDTAGVVLYDSLGTTQVGDALTTQDVVSAQRGVSEVHTGYVQYTEDAVMSISYPLNNQMRQEGIIRLTTSLAPVNALIESRITLFIAFGLIILIISFLLSIFIAKSISKPINELTAVAKKLADGQFEVKAKVNQTEEIGELAKTMNFMSENIVKKEQIKNDFISSISHELRTPLTSIKGWAITLQGENIDPRISGEGLKIIEKESDRLSYMVEDLLDFSRFSSGRVNLTKKNFNIVEVTQNIINQFSPRTREKQMSMIFDYQENPMMITADEGRIKQLLLNIIDNAIKFTPENGTIATDLKFSENDIQITVTDTGIGIGDDEIDLVTGKFWKGSSSASHTGLGLSICEEICKAHGGKLTITSQLGVGTKVLCEFPIEMV